MATLMRSVEWPPKDPEDRRQFGHDWDDAASDPIQTSVWTVEVGLDSDTEEFDNLNVPPRTSIWIEGGEVGGGADERGYEVKNTVTFQSGQILVRRVYLKVEKR